MCKKLMKNCLKASCTAKVSRLQMGEKSTARESKQHRDHLTSLSKLEDPQQLE